VKSQVRSIYMKLDVADRDSALQEGRARGLVPDDLGLPEVEPFQRRLMMQVPQPSAQTSTR